MTHHASATGSATHRANNAGAAATCAGAAAPVPQTEPIRVSLPLWRTQADRVLIVARRSKKQLAELEKEGAVVVDVSATSKQPVGVKFAPTYPHGNVPVPYMPDVKSLSVEGVLQGLKVFADGTGIDVSKFRARGAASLARGKRKFGELAGYKVGEGGAVCDEATARRNVFVPLYTWVLNTYLANELRAMADEVIAGRRVVLLDHSTNEDVYNVDKRFTHASLIKAWLTAYFQHVATVAAERT